MAELLTIVHAQRVPLNQPITRVLKNWITKFLTYKPVVFVRSFDNSGWAKKNELDTFVFLDAYELISHCRAVRR